MHVSDRNGALTRFRAPGESLVCVAKETIRVSQTKKLTEKSHRILGFKGFKFGKGCSFSLGCVTWTASTTHSADPPYAAYSPALDAGGRSFNFLPIEGFKQSATRRSPRTLVTKVNSTFHERVRGVGTVSKNVSKRLWNELRQVRPSTRKHAQVILD